MSSPTKTTSEVTLDQVFSLAQQLRPVDQVRLIARLAPQVETILEQTVSVPSLQTNQPLRGLLSDLGPAPSAKEIDEVQNEMWATFAQE
jgi:hypothetical protein